MALYTADAKYKYSKIVSLNILRNTDGRVHLRVLFLPRSPTAKSLSTGSCIAMRMEKDPTSSNSVACGMWQHCMVCALGRSQHTLCFVCMVMMHVQVKTCWKVIIQQINGYFLDYLYFVWDWDLHVLIVFLTFLPEGRYTMNSYMYLDPV